MIEFADGLDRRLQLKVLVKPAAHLGDTFVAHAELTRALSGYVTVSPKT